MQPIREKLGDVNHLIISPDSQLNLIPFAALVDENNQYLLGNYQITDLTTGRDLIRFQNEYPQSDQHPYYWAVFVPVGDWTAIEN